MMVIEKKIHSNVIIRKNIKTKAKMGKMLIEIYDDTIAGIYPVYYDKNGNYPEGFSARLKRHSIHPDTWKKVFGSLMKRDGLRTHIVLSNDQLRIIKTFFEKVYPVIMDYKILGKTEKRILECIFINSIKNG